MHLPLGVVFCEYGSAKVYVKVTNSWYAPEARGKRRRQRFFLIDGLRCHSTAL